MYQLLWFFSLIACKTILFAEDQSESITDSLFKTATVEGDEESRTYKLSFSADLKEVIKHNKDKFPIPTIDVYVRKYNVTHEFISGTSGKPLDPEVLAELPSNQTGKKDGSEVEPSDFTNKEVTVTGGKWIFKDWDAETKTITGADQKFIGTWEYVESSTDEVKYKVSYEFVSGTPGKELPKEVIALIPLDQDDKEDGSVVTPDTPQTPDVPKTPNLGESLNVNIWYMMLFVSLSVVVSIAIKKKKA